MATKSNDNETNTNVTGRRTGLQPLGKNTDKAMPSKASAEKTPSAPVKSEAASAKTDSKGKLDSKGKKTSEKEKNEDIVALAREANAKKKEYMDEVVLILIGLLGILFYLSYFDKCGIIGKGIKNLMFGLLGGFLPYIFPVALFAIVLYILKKPEDTLAFRRTTIFMIMQIVLAALIHLFSNVATEYKFFQSFKVGYQQHRGGGLFGACLAKPLYLLFGKIASVLILIAFLLVCIILILGRGVFIEIKKYFDERKKIKQAAYDETFGDDSPYAVAGANTSSQVFTLEEIQEENRKRRVHLVDAVPPEVNPDLSFYGKVEQPEPEKKAGFLDKLLGHNKKPAEKPTYTAEYQYPAKGTSASEGANVSGEQPDAGFEPGQMGRDSYVSQSGHPFYQIELDNKFRETNGSSGGSIIKTGYENPSGSAYRADANEREAARREAVDRKLNGGSAPIGDIPISGLPNSPKPEIDANAVNPYDAVETSEAVAPSREELAMSGIKPTGQAAQSGAGKQTDSAAKPATETPSDDLTEFPDTSQQPIKEYKFPPISLLKRASGKAGGMTPEKLKETAAKLQSTLQSFGVNVTVTNISCGPSVTRYELTPEQGVKVSRITNLENDIKLNLAAEDIRIEAPIPGKSAVGIEVPNSESSGVLLRSLIETEEFEKNKGKISFAVGKDIGGNNVYSDIDKMPHLLIAGATGSGKSVCINTMIISLLYKYKPEDLRIIMIDPKVVELSVYNDIPHLYIPVVTDPRKASNALNWAVIEMTRRYEYFSALGVRNLEGYNDKIASMFEPPLDKNGNEMRKMPQIVIIVDELADLMMVAPGEVEDAICRLAQLARAAGIHLVIATQRPSVDVITGLIKANIPSRIAFAVSSGIDSRTILDQIGAEKLLGKGDMLFYPQGIPKPIRLQGPFVSDEEIAAIVDYLKKNNGANYDKSVAKDVSNGVSNVAEQMKGNSDAGDNDGRDEYFAQAGRFIIEKDKASIGMLQRVYKIGFNRAARIMDQLSEAGVVGPEEGTKPRKILMSAEEFEAFLQTKNN